MKAATTFLLLLGLGLLGWIVYQTDLGEVIVHLRQIGWPGFAAILGVYFVAFALDTASWAWNFPARPPTATWQYRLWKVLMFGSALNRVTPLAQLGGEPVKVALLKAHYGVPYREATASLILAKTVATIALVIFVALGFVLMLEVDSLSGPYRLAASAGLAGFALCILLFFLVQQHKLFSRTGGWLTRGRMGARVRKMLDIVHDVEDQLIAYYTRHRRRFATSLALAFLNWVLGAVEVYIALALFGHPVSFADAWVIESVVLLVRSALFFVPANLGTQDGTMVLICGAITGVPALGLALAVVVRLRELVWILWGLAVGWTFTGTPSVSVSAAEKGLGPKPRD